MPDLHRVRLVALREWTTRLRQRTFQITTIIQVLFLLVGASVPTVAAVFFSDEDGGDAASILVLDEANTGLVDRLPAYLDADGAGEDAVIRVEAASGTADELRARVDDGDADGALIATRKIRPRTTCLYSAASMCPRRMSAASQSRRFSAFERVEDVCRSSPICTGALLRYGE
jgi:hypothetical protein